MIDFDKLSQNAKIEYSNFKKDGLDALGMIVGNVLKMKSFSCDEIVARQQLLSSGTNIRELRSAESFSHSRNDIPSKINENVAPLTNDGLYSSCALIAGGRRVLSLAVPFAVSYYNDGTARIKAEISKNTLYFNVNQICKKLGLNDGDILPDENAIAHKQNLRFFEKKTEYKFNQKDTLDILGHQSLSNVEKLGGFVFSICKQVSEQDFKKNKIKLSSENEGVIKFMSNLISCAMICRTINFEKADGYNFVENALNLQLCGAINSLKTLTKQDAFQIASKQGLETAKYLYKTLDKTPADFVGRNVALGEKLDELPEDFLHFFVVKRSAMNFEGNKKNADIVAGENPKEQASVLNNEKRVFPLITCMSDMFAEADADKKEKFIKKQIKKKIINTLLGYKVNSTVEKKRIGQIYASDYAANAKIQFEKVCKSPEKAKLLFEIESKSVAGNRALMPIFAGKIYGQLLYSAFYERRSKIICDKVSGMESKEAIDFIKQQIYDISCKIKNEIRAYAKEVIIKKSPVNGRNF